MTKKDITNNNEKLLKNIYNSLRLSTTNSITISYFYLNWKGWNGNKNIGLPGDIQDINEFLVYFMDSISDDLRSLFSFKATESNDIEHDYPFLRVSLSDFNHNLQSIILNDITTTTHPLTYPKKICLFY